MSDAATTTLPAGRWSIDPAHSSVSFTVRHMAVSKVRGRFAEFDAEIVTTENPFDSTVRATVQMASIDTGDGDRDRHLRTNDFFDIEHHPEMTFVSTGIAGSGADYRIEGDLTIRGVTKRVTFDLEVGGAGKDPWGNTKAGFTLTGTIDRKDFGIQWNAPLETGGFLVGDKVSIEIDIEAALQT